MHNKFAKLCVCRIAPEISNNVGWVEMAWAYTPELGEVEGSEADAATSAGFALRLGSSESHWVLLSRHWILASRWGNGGKDAAAVWSSDRLFPEIADRKGSSLITRSNIGMPPCKHLPSSKLPLLLLWIYSRGQGDQNAFHFTRSTLFQEHQLVTALILFWLAHSSLATLHSH